MEADVKLRFLEKLMQQIDKRIETCNFQTNILRKKKKLFSIYGGKKQHVSGEVHFNTDSAPRDPVAEEDYKTP